MKVEVQKIDKLKRKVRIEVSGEEFLSERKEIYKDAAKNLKVPGFRPGTAPLDVLERHHGPLLKEEFLKRSLPSFYQQALKEHNISPASLPKIYDVEVNSDNLSFWAEFEAKPEIEIKETSYKGIKIKDKKCAVSKVETEKIITNLKEGIKKVTGKDLDDLTLAKWATFPDIAALEEGARHQIFTQKLNQRRQDIESQIRKHLLKSVKIDLPASEVERHHKELVERDIYNLRLRGVSQEDLDKYKKDLEDKLRPVAGEEVKLFYILEAIAKNEGIKVEDNLAEVVLGFILSQAIYE